MENIDIFYYVVILKAFVLKFHHKESLKLFMEWGKLNLFNQQNISIQNIFNKTKIIEKKTNRLIEIWAKDMNRQFTGKEA